jgi:hypothetical protein
MLSRLLNVFQPEPVTLVGFHNGVLTFISHKPRTVGQKCAVRFSVPDGSGSHFLDLNLTVEHVRRTPHLRGSICVARLPFSDSKIESQLRSIQVNPGLAMLGRQHPRVPVGLRARSRELPGFAGVVQDLSQTGARLDVAAPVHCGAKVQLVVELEDQAPLQLRGSVAWVRPATFGSGYVIGLECAGHESDERLADYLQWLEQDREVEDVQLRTLRSA